MWGFSLTNELLSEKQTLPYSASAEKAVLGGVLRDRESLLLIEGLLEPQFFFIDAHLKTRN